MAQLRLTKKPYIKERCKFRRNELRFAVAFDTWGPAEQPQHKEPSGGAFCSGLTPRLGALLAGTILRRFFILTTATQTSFHQSRRG